MRWILDNIWVLLLIAGGIAQFLKNRKDATEGDREGGSQAPRDFEFEDPELAERTRRIREDIQRKIAQRQRGGPVQHEEDVRDEPPPFVYEPETPPPVYREVVIAPPPRPVIHHGYGTRHEHERAAEILEQQANLADRLRQAEAMKASTQRRANFEETLKPAGDRLRRKARGEVLEDLRDPAALRRAFILREVLGPPVGLR